MTDQRTTALAKRRSEMMDTIGAAAIEQFALHGLRGTSTQTIAERAGISKQQLHYYIESKEALYESILLRTMEHWGQIGLYTEDANADPAEAIARLVRRKLDFTFAHPQVSRLFTNEIISGGPVMQTICANGAGPVNAAVAIIAVWVRKQLIAPVDPMFLLFHIWALTQHYADYELQVRFFTGCPPGQPLEREKICTEVTNFVLRGVGLAVPGAALPPPAARRTPRKTPTR